MPMRIRKVSGDAEAVLEALAARSRTNKEGVRELLREQGFETSADITSFGKVVGLLFPEGDELDALPLAVAG